MKSPFDNPWDETEAGQGEATRHEADEEIEVAGGLDAGRIAGYAILRPLGEGGGGTVIAAYDESLDRRVAIKILHRSRVGDSTAHQRIFREAQAMARLSHPNVVRVYEVGEERGRVFLVMEHIDGGTLYDWMREEHAWPELREVFVQAGQGLGAAHRAGLVHRDFKPANVMVIPGEPPRVKVLDFGLARRGDADTAALAESLSGSSMGDSADELRSDGGSSLLGAQVTEHGLAMGTPAYMSPEQFRGRDLDARTDQFSFCVALWEAITGTRPFKGSSARKRLGAIKRGVPQGQWEAARHGTPPHVRDALVRGLSYEAGDRWPDMASLLDELRRNPSQGRRRLWAVGAGLVGMVGLGIAAVASRPEPCGPSPETQQEWAQGRGRLVEHFATLTTPLAEDTGRRITAHLDAWVGDWQQIEGELCEGERSPAASLSSLRLTEQCLEDRRRQLAQLVDYFETLDEQAIVSAIQATEELPPALECRDARLLLDRHPRPEDPKTAELAQEIRRELGKLRLAAPLGRLEAHQVQGLLDRAETLGFEPLIAEVEALEGGRLSIALEIEAAIEMERRALDRALACRHFALATSLSRSLAFDLQRASHFDESRLAIEMALGFARASEDPAELATALSMLGTIEHGAGRPELSERAHSEAVDLAEKIEEATASSPWNNYGWFLVANERPKEAIPYLEKALAIDIELLGEHHPNVARTLSNLSSAHVLLEEYDEAQEGYERALAILTAAHGKDFPGAYVPHHMMARMAEDRKHYEDALARFRAARRLVQSLPKGHHWYLGANRGVIANLMNLERWEEAEAELDAVVKEMPDDLPKGQRLAFQLMRIEIATSRGQAPDYAFLDECARDDELSLGRQVNCLWTASTYLDKEERYEEAAAKRVRILERTEGGPGGDYSPTYFELATHRIDRAGDPEGGLTLVARVDPDKAIYANPGRWWFLKARGLLAIGRRDEAVDAIERAETWLDENAKKEVLRKVRAWRRETLGEGE